MSSDDGAFDVCGVDLLHAADESIGSHDVECGHPEDVLGVLACLGVHLAGNGHCAVHGVADDTQLGFWADLGRNTPHS